jgi:hypothetical protein
MTGMVFDGDTPRMTASGPEIVALALPTSEIHILETWRSLGMRGTDSNDVSVNAAFVPTSRSFRVTPEFERAKAFRGPLYRLPATVSVNAVVAPVALAVARGAITELREVADRRTPLGSVKTMRHRPAVQSAVAEAEALLRSARLLFFDTLATAWRRALAAEPFTLEHKADLLLASTQCRAHGVPRGGLDASDGRLDRRLHAESAREAFSRRPDHPASRLSLREPARNSGTSLSRGGTRLPDGCLLKGRAPPPVGLWRRGPPSSALRAARSSGRVGPRSDSKDPRRTGGHPALPPPRRSGARGLSALCGHAPHWRQTWNKL